MDFLPKQTIVFPSNKKHNIFFSLIKNKLFFSSDVTDKLFCEDMFNLIN